LAKLSESIQIVNYYTFWALRADKQVMLEKRKLLGLGLTLLAIPLGILIDYILRKFFDYGEAEIVKAKSEK
jgi:hypothetical protein